MASGIEAGNQGNPISFDGESVEFSKIYHGSLGTGAVGIRVSVGTDSYHLQSDNAGIMPDEVWTQPHSINDSDSIRNLVRNYYILAAQGGIARFYGENKVNDSIEYNIKIGALITTVITPEKSGNAVETPVEIGELIKFFHPVVMGLPDNHPYFLNK